MIRPLFIGRECHTGTSAAPRTSSQSTTPAAAATTASASASGVVAHVVDGDTLDVAGVGRIRVIGIDTPERGACGYEQASALMRRLVLGRTVTLTAAPAKDHADRYGRLLRYVDVAGVDAGLAEVKAGFATARYDSRDGYGAHPRESSYVAADEQAPNDGCT
ncbi:MAG: thermonuclease family protein [Dermatophilaceae bacterium]